jgi:hypothetical protein
MFKLIAALLIGADIVVGLTCPSTPAGKYQATEVIAEGMTAGGITNQKCFGVPGASDYTNSR